MSTKIAKNGNQTKLFHIHVIIINQLNGQGPVV
jgi:hypothetical protein